MKTLKEMQDAISRAWIVMMPEGENCWYVYCEGASCFEPGYFPGTEEEVIERVYDAAVACGEITE